LTTVFLVLAERDVAIGSSQIQLHMKLYQLDVPLSYPLLRRHNM